MKLSILQLEHRGEIFKTLLLNRKIILVRIGTKPDVDFEFQRQTMINVLKKKYLKATETTVTMILST